MHEVFSERQYRRHLAGPVEGVMIDLGANIGAVTLDWARRSPQLHVHAYEPNPASNKMLRHNVEANGLTDRVTFYQEAVGREAGELRLWTNVNSLTITGYSDVGPESEAVPLRVPLIDLNEVVKRAGGGPVALLKMDTEGAEADTTESDAPDSTDPQAVVRHAHDGDVFTISLHQQNNSNQPEPYTSHSRAVPGHQI